MDWHNISIEETIKILESSISNGLSSDEANKRIIKYGKNILKEKKKKSLLHRFILQFADFMIIILLLAAFISFLGSYIEGKPNYIEPLIILIIITLNAILGLIHESKAEHSLEALKKMSAPLAHVIRDKIVLELNANLLVPGDIILLETGSFIPADARLISSSNLKVEESSLTGESYPVEKFPNVILKEKTLISDRVNLVMATSMVTYGRGIAIVTNTGMNTEVGHIAKLIMEDETPDTPLQKRLHSTGKILGLVAVIICLIIFIIGILRKAPVFHMFMTSVSLAVAAIPEGLPAIVTIMLSLGVQRMAKKNAVIRKLPAVETLGSATIICSDKTGTLTKNMMTVTKIASLSGFEDNMDFQKYILSHGSLCNDSIIQKVNGKINTTGEATENALVNAAYSIGLNKKDLDKDYKRIDEIPFDSSRKLMTTIHKSKDQEYRSITKGAFDILLNRCDTVYYKGEQIPLTREYMKKLILLNNEMTNSALRVIAVAYKHLHKSNIKANASVHEHNLCFIGLIGMIDPPRDKVKESVSICKKAGIRPIMITGDHILTAKAIASEIGILNPGQKALSGEEIAKLSVNELAEIINNYTVFARVAPEHKVKIVKAFQMNNEVVAMTGDGVNDAPALKVADIGCAMGITGTDVSKAAADIILTDDNFATIVAAIKEGRGIYDNIKKSIHFLLSCNIGEIITIFIAILYGLPTPLLAIQLLWVNLVTDSLPAISLGMEPVEDDVMNRKPISPKEGLFANGLMYKIIFEGILIGSLALTAFVIGVRYYDKEHFLNPIHGRTMAFAVLSIAQLFHSFNMKSIHSISQVGIFSNVRLVISFIICLMLQITVISLPILAKIFLVTPLNIRQWAIVFLLSFIPIVVMEIQKKFI